jgi:glyoxylase-like metal-dependent hydrolase (beta-lactamase superfamily II)
MVRFATTELPPPVPVLPGLWRLAGPMPYHDCVYSYAFELDGGGIALIDTGWDHPAALEALRAGLHAMDATLADVRGVAVTHVHPDHYGLAPRVCEASGAWLAVHQVEAELLRARSTESERLLAENEVWLREAGLPDEELAEGRRWEAMLQLFGAHTAPTIEIADGDTLPMPGWDLVALHCPGHSPGHVCFHERRRGFVLTGDHVLAAITPNISSHPQAGPGALADYLGSLRRLLPLGLLQGFPSHGPPMETIGPRVEELLSHHERQLDEAYALVAGSRPAHATAWDVARGIRWSRPWEEITGVMRNAAIGEADAHLRVLALRGLVERASERPVRWRALSR